MTDPNSARELSDAEISRLLGESHPEGARALFQLHGGGVLEVLSSRHGQEVALEALSEAYIKVIRSQSYDESKGSLKGWLFRIADRCAIDIHSGKRVIGRREWEEPLDEHDRIQDGGDAFDIAVLDPQVQAMAEALPEVIEECLTPALRQVVKAWLEGHGNAPSRELAECLGRSVSSFDTNLTRARVRIKQAMIDRGLFTEASND